MLGNALSYRTLIPLRLQQAQGTIICLRTQRQAPSHTEFQVHLSSFIACCTSVCDIMGPWTNSWRAGLPICNHLRGRKTAAIDIVCSDIFFVF